MSQEAMSESAQVRGQYLCESCAGFYHAQGMCPRCEDEPLVDVNDDDAMRLIRERDQRRHFKRAAKFTIVSIIVMVPLNLILFVLSSKYIMFSGHSTGDLNSLILVAHVGLFGVSVLWGEGMLLRMFPTTRISALIDGDEGVQHASLSERFSTFIAALLPSK